MKTSKYSEIRRAYSRRDFLRLTGMAGGALALAACAAPAATVPSGDDDATMADDVTTIAWWNQFSSPTTQEVFPQVVGEFEERNPNIKVEFEISGGPPGGGDYIEVLLARIAAGNPPETATLWSPPSQFGARGALTEIDDLMTDAEMAQSDAFFEGPLNSCRWAGKTYGLPASAGASSVFINKEMFDEKGISTSRDDFPTTWAGLQELSAQFTAWEGDELTSAGIVPWSASWLKPVWSQLNGGTLFDAENQAYAIDSAQNIEWLTSWVSWLEAEYGGDIEQLNLNGNFGDAYPDGAFQLGLSAMTQDGSWACTDAAIPFEWDVMHYPVGPSGTNSATGFWPNWWVMPKGVAHVEEAFLLCEWFCTQGWVTWYRAVMDTPAWKNFPEGELTQALVDAQGLERAQAVHDFFADYLNSAAAMWNSPVEDFASDTLDAAIDEVMHKTKSPEEALAEAQGLIQAKLDETLQS